MSTTISPTFLSEDYILSDPFDNTTLCANHLISELLEGQFGRMIWGILQIILMILGDIGNILIIIILNRRLMRKGGVNNLLQGLAMSDIVAPTIACIPHIIYHYGPRTNDNLINFINLYVMPIATGGIFCSNWIVVTITSFRLMVVFKPLYSQVYCSNYNEKKALIIIFLCSIVSITPYYYYHSSPDAQYIIKVVSAVISLLIPWGICVILWIVLLRIVNREIGSKRSKKFTLHADVVAQRLKSKSRITRMVLIICFFNIICQLPVLILTILGLINGNPCGNILAVIFVCLLFFSNILLTFNHSVNFFIYSLTNTKFRCALKIMCRHCYSCYNRRKMKRQKTLTTKYDEQRPQIAYKHKCNDDTRSSSRIDETPRLVITMRSRTISRQNEKKKYAFVPV